ncbi:MAG: hypothetical protein JHC31_02675 [Sulfurihydrogenibium sp.]|jgi:hypothetical protein|nr:hypothetical protein [Sulfurihydrogenibium sp.]
MSKKVENKISARKASIIEQELSRIVVGFLSNNRNTVLNADAFETNIEKFYEKHKNAFFDAYVNFETAVAAKFSIREKISQFNCEHGINTRLTNIERIKTMIRGCEPIISADEMDYSDIKERFAVFLSDGKSDQRTRFSFPVGIIDSKSKKMVTDEVNRLKIEMRTLQDEIAFINNSMYIELGGELVEDLKKLGLY